MKTPGFAHPVPVFLPFFPSTWHLLVSSYFTKHTKRKIKPLMQPFVNHRLRLLLVCCLAVKLYIYIYIFIFDDDDMEQVYPA